MALILISVSSLFKRMLYFNAEFYLVFSIIPFLLLLRRFYSRDKLTTSAILIAIIALSAIWNYDLFGKYYPSLIALSLLSFSRYADVRIYKYFVWLFFFSLLYALYQNHYGYSSWELAYLDSGLGTVAAAGLLLKDDIRAFSVFSGIPEASFFFACSFYVFYTRKSHLFAIFSLVGLLVCGSRGVIVSGFVAWFLLLWPWSSKWKLVLSTFSLNLVLYGFLIFVIPLTGFLDVKDDELRLFTFGTISYRFSLLLEFIVSFELANIIFPLKLSVDYLDNWYLTVFSDLGLILGLIYLTLFFKAIPSSGHITRFSFLCSVGYCLYSDALFSMYFIVLIFLFHIIESSAQNYRHSPR